jgi:hypothetical protein
MKCKKCNEEMKNLGIVPQSEGVIRGLSPFVLGT